MADLSTAAQQVINGLASAAAGGLVEEYTVGKRRMRRGLPSEQVDAAIKLDAIAARQASGLCQRAKLRTDRE